MGRKILNRKEMRADYDAAERRRTNEEGELDEEEDEEGDEDEDEEEEGEDAEADGDVGDDDDDLDGDDDDDEDRPRKKKKAKAAKVKEAKPKAKSRSRAAKVVRMKVVWGVFSNSNQRVATYEYNQRQQADEHAARLMNDKKSTHFVQPVKEPMEEKKEKEEK